MSEESSVCIEDFCGRYRGMQVSFSADFFPTEKLTYFTGDWDAPHDVPPMPCETEPTNAQVWAWAHLHGSGWQGGRPD